MHLCNAKKIKHATHTVTYRSDELVKSQVWLCQLRGMYHCWIS